MDTTPQPGFGGVFDEVSKFLHNTVQRLAHFFGINPRKDIRAGRESLQQIDLKGEYFIGTKPVGQLPHQDMSSRLPLTGNASIVTFVYMPITGTRQSLITTSTFTEDSIGNTYQGGYEDRMMVQGFSHEVIIPCDPQSDQPTGQRMYKPVIITKVFDKASPLLLVALTSNERPTKIGIRWHRTSVTGTQEHHYTAVSEDVIIVDIKNYTYDCQDPGSIHFTHLEDVHFTCRKITWTHEVSDTSGSDD